MFEIALRPFGLPAKRPRPRIGGVDPDKWSYQDDGEYYRVIFDGGSEGRLISTETYAARVTKRLLVIQKARKKMIATLVLFLIFVWSRHHLTYLLVNSDSYGSHRPNYFIVNLMLYEHTTFLYATFYEIVIFVSGLSMLGTFGEWVMCTFRLASPSYAAGPRPVPPPGLEEVERQMIHGVGGFAGQSEIDRAARGGAANAADHLTFED